MHMRVYRNQVPKVFLHTFVSRLSAPPNQYHIFWTQFLERRRAKYRWGITFSSSSSALDSKLLRSTRPDNITAFISPKSFRCQWTHPHYDRSDTSTGSRCHIIDSNSIGKKLVCHLNSFVLPLVISWNSRGVCGGQRAKGRQRATDSSFM